MFQGPNAFAHWGFQCAKSPPCSLKKSEWLRGGPLEHLPRRAGETSQPDDVVPTTFGASGGPLGGLLIGGLGPQSVPGKPALAPEGPRPSGAKSLLSTKGRCASANKQEEAPQRPEAQGLAGGVPTCPPKGGPTRGGCRSEAAVPPPPGDRGCWNQRFGTVWGGLPCQSNPPQNGAKATFGPEGAKRLIWPRYEINGAKQACALWSKGCLAPNGGPLHAEAPQNGANLGGRRLGGFAANPPKTVPKQACSSARLRRAQGWVGNTQLPPLRGGKQPFAPLLRKGAKACFGGASACRGPPKTRGTPQGLGTRRRAQASAPEVAPASRGAAEASPLGDVPTALPI